MDSILQSLNKLLADPLLTATIHNAERLTANLDVTTRQLNSLMDNELPQITGRLVTITDNFSVSENLKGIDYASTFSKVDSTLYNVQLLTENSPAKIIPLAYCSTTDVLRGSTTAANTPVLCYARTYTSSAPVERIRVYTLHFSSLISISNVNFRSRNRWSIN